MSQTHFEARIWQVDDGWQVNLREITGGSVTEQWRAYETFDTRVEALDWARTLRDQIVQKRAAADAYETVRL